MKNNYFKMYDNGVTLNLQHSWDYIQNALRRRKCFLIIDMYRARIIQYYKMDGLFLNHWK